MKRNVPRFYERSTAFEINEDGQTIHDSTEDDVLSKVVNSAKLEMDLNDDGTPKLVFLTKLPRIGFSKQILQRRVLQWRRMGLGYMDIEPSLFNTDVDEMYSKYIELEENVRRATELERYVLRACFDSQERTIALFRYVNSLDSMSWNRCIFQIDLRRGFVIDCTIDNHVD